MSHALPRATVADVRREFRELRRREPEEGILVVADPAFLVDEATIFGQLDLPHALARLKEFRAGGPRGRRAFQDLRAAVRTLVASGSGEVDFGGGVAHFRLIDAAPRGAPTPRLTCSVLSAGCGAGRDFMLERAWVSYLHERAFSRVRAHVPRLEVGTLTWHAVTLWATAEEVV